jgi:hypothetical protein
MNRPPAPTEAWVYEHQFSCGGTFIKTKEPRGFVAKKKG